MNLQQWAALPPDIQKVFTDLSHSASAFCGLTLEDYSNSIQEEEKKAGDEIYVVSHAELAQWTQAVQPIEAEWKETVKAKGINPDAILEKLKQAADKYRQSPYPPDEWWRK
jgi:TRAP-type C4-dicarboxylate transport system substrate-binding protein